MNNKTGMIKIREPKNPRKDKSHWLYILVIIAVFLGILFGWLSPDQAKGFAVLGKMFVSLVTMMISPIIFCTIVLGIGSVRSAASVGRAGGIALLYFIIMSTFALTIGLVVGNIIKPGTGLVVATQPIKTQTPKHAEGAIDFLQGLIPKSLFAPLVDNKVLQTLVIALLIGFALQTMGKAGEPVLTAIGHIQKLVFKILIWILWLAPIGAFGAISGVVGSTGLKAIGQFALLMLSFYLTCLLFIFIVLGSVLWFFAKVSIFSFLKYLGRELILIVATSSSESALPSLMAKMEHAGVNKATVGIVVPTGYSFNLDGTAIYLTMASIFIADAMHKPMSIPEQLGLLLFMIIASKGAAGVSGAGIATLSAGLQSHRPELLDGVGVIAGIDRFMSEARALTNFSGNAVSVVVVGRMTKTLNQQRLKDVLAGKLPFHAESTAQIPIPDASGVVDPADKLIPTPQTEVTPAEWEEETKTRN